MIHGPNLNLLGSREPEVYGNNTLQEINKLLMEIAYKNNVELEIIQSNSEGEIIDKLHLNADINGIIINPAAYTHYSLAIYDAIKGIKSPVIEVHISNIYSREDFRKKSVTAGACIGVISGFGYYSYVMALYAFLNEGLQNKGDMNVKKNRSI